MIQELLEDIIGVEVPEGAKLLHCDVDFSERSYLAYKFKDDLLANEYELRYLPPGNWQFLFTSDDATEEQAAMVVRYYHLSCNYEDYTPANPNIQFCGMYLPTLQTATESLSSLLQSKGLKGNCAILKKQ